MIDVLQFLAPPFVACVVLVAILGYFGLHVLLRGVIFVDLALAQIAALGTLMAYMVGHQPGSLTALAFSLAAALVGAAIFSFSRTPEGDVPQEAIIGITYIVASALGIVIADRAPEGAEHIKEVLAGAILWVTWETVLRDLVICAAVGALHWRLRERFRRVSERPAEAAAAGWSLPWWDFLFYASFAVVVTVAVEIAGVLMVFAYLVAPAILALGISRRWAARLAIAWGAGLAASALGLLASYEWDLPSGPAIVCTLGAFLVAYAGWRWLRPRRWRNNPGS
ncbi:MAG TPA: iron chelate uptake ABC transporter family permease subunit [Thermoanaerobaculia bacterium]|nr:iron chelate uptake ABC transporter family permease subunit [Thermoanaerobaculia bacterium]